MLVALALLLGPTVASVKCGGACCCQVKAATAVDYQARGVLGSPGCCGCSYSRQAEDQPAVPEYVVQYTDGHVIVPVAGFSAVPHPIGAKAAPPASARGSTPHISPPIYKLVLSYLC